jgi:hypothetical protein
MPAASPATTRTKKRIRRIQTRKPSAGAPLFSAFLLVTGLFLIGCVWWFHDHYTLSFQSPVRLHFQSPIVVAMRDTSEVAVGARADQHQRPLSAWQQYACRKFGADCRIALAIQRAENAEGKCEIYHYNTDGTLDWGYFQINTVHLKRPGLNLRDLLDCQANIDFAYQLYQEKGGFTPWSTFNDGSYKRYMRALD